MANPMEKPNHLIKLDQEHNILMGKVYPKSKWRNNHKSTKNRIHQDNSPVPHVKRGISHLRNLQCTDHNHTHHQILSYVPTQEHTNLNLTKLSMKSLEPQSKCENYYLLKIHQSYRLNII